ncbi:hypothetical protein [Microbacterium sp. KHB019]|uniref:hypothetical protein n=1 Tax=Microbacterium sp. KHB019 TaxID=3129770 RepID=UPI003079AB49
MPESASNSPSFDGAAESGARSGRIPAWVRNPQVNNYVQNKRATSTADDSSVSSIRSHDGLQEA